MTAPLPALADTPSLYWQLVSLLPEGVLASEPLAWKAPRIWSARPTA